MPLVTEVEGLSLRFTNDLDIDDDGNVYFTDISSVCQRRNYMQLVFSGETSGRVLKYDLVTKQTIVLLKDVLFPNGLSLCKDQKFFVICQASGRLKRYWLKGEKVGRSEIFANLPWKTIFDIVGWENLMVRFIILKLQEVMRESLINPADQKLHQ